MPCYHPITGYRSRQVNPVTGKRGIVFAKKEGFYDMPVTLPCGRCIGCRLERSRQWAIRCVHEASLHDKNCFITLTYSDENLPEGRTLVKEDFQKFMKRLRKKFGELRFFHCGEYGEKYGRPHYHACLFGFSFDDIAYYYRNGNFIRTSPILEEIWGKGLCHVGDVTFESAAYVARYITKKLSISKNSKEEDIKKFIDKYNDVDYSTGEVLAERIPEYITMSRRPGIAAGWFEKYSGDIYNTDSVIIRGREMKPPKFYDSKYEIMYPSDMRRVKVERKEEIKDKDSFGLRLLTREKIANINDRRKERDCE